MNMRKILVALALLACTAPALSAQIMVETARRAYLGFSFDREMTDGELQLSVRDVRDDSPAARAGLQVGDVILRLNGLNATERLLSSIVGSLSPGDTVTLRIRRSDRERELRLVAAEPPAGYFRGVAAFTLHPDSVQRSWTLLVDSLRAHMDTARFKFHFDSTARGSVWVFTDSTMNGDSVVVHRFMQRLTPDSMMRRFPFDSLLQHHFHFDSVLRAIPFDSAFGNGVHIFRDGENLFNFEVGPGRADQLRVFGFGTRALAGARLETLNPELGRYFETERGVLVLDVPQGTPARRAGLVPGDVILSVDGRNVSSVSDVYRAFARGEDGSVRLEVLRRGDRRTIELNR